MQYLNSYFKEVGVMNKKNFGLMMKTFSEVYQKEISVYVTKIYFKMLKEIPDSQVPDITKNCLRKCKYFPRPADIFDQLSETPERYVPDNSPKLTKQDMERNRVNAAKIKEMLEGKFEMPEVIKGE